MSLLIGLDTTFIRRWSVRANRAGKLILLGWGVSLLMGLDTTYTRMGSVLANRARQYIYEEGKCPC